MANLSVGGLQSSEPVRESGGRSNNWEISEVKRQVLTEESELEQLSEKEIQDKKQLTKEEASRVSDKTRATAFVDRDYDVRSLLRTMSEKLGQKESGRMALLSNIKAEQEMKEFVQEIAEQATFGDEASFMKERAREQGVQEFKLEQKRQEMGVRQKSLKDAFKELPSYNQDAQDMQAVKFRKKVRQIPQAVPTLSPQETQDVLTKYLSSFSEGILRDSKLKKEQARQTRESLVASGFSSRHITSLEASVRQVIRQDLKRKLKDSFIQMALSYDSKTFSQDMMMHSATFNHVAQQVGLKGLFGPGRYSMKGIKDEAKEELKSVVSDSLDSALMEAKMQGGSAEDLVKTFNKFNDLADIARFDSSEYMKHLNQKIKDWGLTDFTRPDVLGVLDTDMGSNSDGQERQNQKETPSQFEVESLEDDVRALFVEQAVKGTWRSFINSRLSLRKRVKQMKDAGIYSEERLDDLRQEGESFARFRLFDLVRESLEERAVLPVLKGPAYRLARQKYKHAMKRLRVLGTPIPTDEVRLMRDQINEDIFNIVREEFLTIEARLEAMKTDVYLIKKHKELLGILERLKKESNLVVPIRPDGQQAVVTLGENSIVEAA